MSAASKQVIAYTASASNANEEKWETESLLTDSENAYIPQTEGLKNTNAAYGREGSCGEASGLSKQTERNAGALLTALRDSKSKVV